MPEKKKTDAEDFSPCGLNPRGLGFNPDACPPYPPSPPIAPLDLEVS